MISLLLAAGAAAEPSAKFLALEQDWATDKVGLFFQHKDFETAWSNIQRDIEPQLKVASASTAFDREHTDGFGEFYGTESWRQTEEVVY